MKVAVLGSTGMAGHLISQYLHEYGHNVTAYGRKNHPTIKTKIIDVYKIENLYEQLMSESYDCIINCLGLLNENAANNPSLAILLNSYYPQFLVEKFSKTNTKIIHLSTDCVFSGENGPYSETSNRDGKTFYDITKIMGEFHNDKDLVFRNSIIGPEIKRGGIGLFSWFIRQTDTVFGFTNVIWNGVTTLYLAKQINVVLNHYPDLCGIYHLVNDPISKYDLLVIINKEFNRNVKIIKNDNPKSNKSLSNNRKDFIAEYQSYDDMIHEMRLWIMNHENIYENILKEYLI